MQKADLIDQARLAALQAHCPYSHFRVGAALIAGGKLFTGVNIEISSYGLTLCAERSALATAISAGYGPHSEHPITQIAIACIDAPPEMPLSSRSPCGACRQWLADLAPHATIYIYGSDEEFTILDLLPYAFGL